MKSILVFVGTSAFWVALVLVVCICFSWLFHLHIDRMVEALRYVGFTFLVCWFIELLFFKK